MTLSYELRVMSDELKNFQLATFNFNHAACR